jgi:DNA-binding MarR family transcriptional regulator
MNSLRHPEDKEDEQEDMKAVRRRNRSGWLELSDSEDLRFLIDAILDLRPNKQFTPSELQRRAGIDRSSLRRHFRKLIKYEIIEPVPDEEAPKYQINSSGPITEELIKLNGKASRIQAKSRESETENKDIAKALKDASKIQKQFNIFPKPSEMPTDIHLPTDLVPNLPDKIDKEKSNG